jgi:hypothetical protein
MTFDPGRFARTLVAGMPDAVVCADERDRRVAGRRSRLSRWVSAACRGSVAALIMTAGVAARFRLSLPPFVIARSDSDAATS